MRHTFIVNPAAGRGVCQSRLVESLRALDLDVWLTSRPGDAESRARSLLESSCGETVRIYACGGDGTLNEVVNGACGHPGAEVACIPIGSGNDFIRNFNVPADSFMDIGKQLAGEASPVDLIRYRELSGGSADRYAANIANIGFDCNVAANMAKFKSFPLTSGSAAYILAILVTLVRKEGADLLMTFDDGASHEGRVLFAAIGNGAYCGGGLKGVPHAALDDGLMDVSVVKDLPRRMFASLFKKYADGTYIDEERLKSLVIYRKCRKLRVKNSSASRRMGIDGEILPMGDVEFESLPGALRFSLPKQ